MNCEALLSILAAHRLRTTVIDLKVELIKKDLNFLLLLENEQLWAANIYSHLNDRESTLDNAYTERRYNEIVRASTIIKCGLKSHKSSKAVNKFL